MPLNDDQKKLVADRLGGKLPDTCACCGAPKKWAPTDRLFALVEVQGTKVKGGGRFYPCVTVCCANCGYTLLFNSITAGIPLEDLDSA